MLTIATAAKKITNDLTQTETAIDHALSAAGALLASATLARASHSEVSSACGHSAMLRMNKAVESLLSARADMMRAHEALARDAQVHAGLDEPTCPDEIRPAGKALSAEQTLTAA